MNGRLVSCVADDGGIGKELLGIISALLVAAPTPDRDPPPRPGLGHATHVGQLGSGAPTNKLVVYRIQDSPAAPPPRGLIGLVICVDR